MAQATWARQPGGRFRKWSWLKKGVATAAVVSFLAGNFLFLTPPGDWIRQKLAETVITTQHREWAWMFVGAQKRDEMVKQLHDRTDAMGDGHSNLGLIQTHKRRPTDELIKVEDISGKYWTGKKVYVYDPTTIRVVVPNKPGEGEKISSMVQRTGAVMGVNGGGFVDPDGLGNGFAPIGFIMSGGSLLYNDQDGSIPQHVVGFTDQGKLVIGKYTFDELKQLHVNEAVMFYPRVIEDGKPLITSGDGGWGRGPRTAVGQRADGTVIFVVIDGRQAHSVGATLREVQDLLLADGCVNAGFLDGGASSELVVGPDLLTSPSSRYGERRLPSGFLVLDNPTDYKATRIWDGLTSIDPGGKYDNPGYLQEQAALKAKGELSPSPTRTPTPRTSATVSPHPSATPVLTPRPRETTMPTPEKTVKPTPVDNVVSTPAPTPTAKSTLSTSPTPTAKSTLSTSSTPTAKSTLTTSSTPSATYETASPTPKP